MDNSHSDQPPAQDPQEATEPAPAPASPSQPHQGAPYPPNTAYPAYPRAQSMPLPQYAPPLGYQGGPQPQIQTPVPGSYPQNPPPYPYSRPPQGAIPPYSGYQGQAPQTKPSNIVEQFTADSKLVITRPSAASFDSIQGHANMKAVLLGILVVGGAYAIAASIIGAGLFEGLIGTFFGFFISLGIMMLVAKVLGGVGDWRTFAYAIAVFDVPLGIADAAAIIIPRQFWITVAAKASRFRSRWSEGFLGR